MNAKGQALVETALIVPILILMLLGVMEVGWALRNYLLLANANREAARFAARPGYLDMNNPWPVYTHTLDSLSGQVPFTESMRVSYFEFAVPCTGTASISSPLNIPTYTWVVGEIQTRIDYSELVSEQVRLERTHSCAKVNTPFISRVHQLVIVEMYYEQPQLFGLVQLLDPIPMYFHSTFRVLDRREQ